MAPLTAADLFWYWSADRGIEDQALALCEPGPLPAGFAELLQRAIRMERESIGHSAPPVGEDLASLRLGLQESWRGLAQRLPSRPTDPVEPRVWELLATFVRRRAHLFVHLRNLGRTPPLIIPFEAAALTPAEGWDPEMPVGHLFPLYEEGHLALHRFWRRVGPAVFGCREAANHLLHAVVWEEFLTGQVTGWPPVVDPAWFKVGVGAYVDHVAMRDLPATWERVADHTRQMLAVLRARDLTGRQPYRNLTYHFTLWYGQCHALHHLFQAETYYTEHLHGPR